MTVTTIKTKNIKKLNKINHHRSLDHPDLDLNLGGHLSSQTERLFDNKNKNEKRKGEPIPERRNQQGEGTHC